MSTPGDAAKAAGIAQANDNADAAWRAVFDAELLRLAQGGVPFTTDDVVDESGLPPAGMSPNAVGARVNAAARRGWILPTGVYRKGERVARHSGMSREWIGTGTAKLQPVPDDAVVRVTITAAQPDPTVAPGCPKCGKPLHGLVASFDPRFVEGRCSDHGQQAARVA